MTTQPWTPGDPLYDPDPPGPSEFRICPECRTSRCLTSAPGGPILTPEDFNQVGSREGAVLMALGAASMCWEYPEGAGIFLSEYAKQIGVDLIKYLDGIGADDDRTDR